MTVVNTLCRVVLDVAFPCSTAIFKFEIREAVVIVKRHKIVSTFFKMFILWRF